MAFRPRKTFERELRGQPEFQTALKERTRVLAAVIIAAPPHATGYFDRRVRVRGNRVVLLDPFWHLIEFGSANNPPYAPVRRAVRALGLRFADAHADSTGPVDHMPGIS